MSTHENKRFISIRKNSHQALHEFCKEYEKAVADGFSMPDIANMPYRDMPRIRQAGAIITATLFKDGVYFKEDLSPTKDHYAEAKAQEKLGVDLKINQEKYLAELKELNKKEEILSFAKAVNISIPEDISHVKSIKSFLKNKIES